VAVDATDPGAVAGALTTRTRIVFVETPTNPRLRTCDVAALAGVVHGRGALLAVDHSMLSPLLLRPLEHGADLAVQSATKLLGGHGDLTAGVVACRDADLARRLRWMQNAEGTALAPFPAWLLLRGLETLDVRLARQLDNARVVVPVLAAHPAVRRLRYPDTGTVISFETGSLDRSRAVVRNARLFRTTVSFGGVTSSISLPCSMSHAAVPAERRRAQGLPEDLVRVSVGIEAAEDLIADLTLALDSIDAPAAVAPGRVP
jgi:cystathionine beta-lyase